MAASGWYETLKKTYKDKYGEDWGKKFQADKVDARKRGLSVRDWAQEKLGKDEYERLIRESPGNADDKSEP